MNICIYCSIYGHTKKVASKLNIPIFDAKYKIPKFNKLIILCPTYGDEEILPEMEDFLDCLNEKNKEYCVCELGNYYGYDDLGFGPYQIIKNKLSNLNWKEFYKHLSLDSMPIIDWESFFKWRNGLNEILHKS